MINNIDEAIQHCIEVIGAGGCQDCMEEHVQLVDWLRELKYQRMLRDAQDKYLAFIGDELEKLTVTAHCHGYLCPEATFETGKRLREGMEKLKTIIDNPI